jgi:hypothetical protein
MLTAAFTSALPAKPQAVHRNTAWLSREPRSTRPHAEHRWLVNAGLTFSAIPLILDSCDIPIVLAPLAGGPSTPELAAAVSFGIPDGDVMAGLRARGTEVWVTVTRPEQAQETLRQFAGPEA